MLYYLHTAKFRKQRMKTESDLRKLLPGGSDDSDDDLAECQTPAARRRTASGGDFFFKILLFGPILFASCFLSFAAGRCMTKRTAPASLDTQCANHTTTWSPLLNDVNVRYEPKVFDGAFMTENIYRKTGSPEVDKAWEDLGVDYRAGIISYEDGLASGLKPSFVQRAEKYGGGFLVNVEGLHHLHCLNLLRKSLYFNYDHYKQLGHHAFVNDEVILRPHITHCLDAIRQVLMCNVDTAVLGQVWAGENQTMAFPDFNTQHKCKNYDDIREWGRKLQRPPNDEIPEDYLAEPRLGDVLPVVP